MTETETTTITLSNEEFVALAGQVTTIVGQTGVNGEQAIEVLCSALAMVLVCHDVSLAAIKAVCGNGSLPKKIVEYARQLRKQGFGFPSRTRLQ